MTELRPFLFGVRALCVCVFMHDLLSVALLHFVCVCVYWHGLGVWFVGVSMLKFRGWLAQAVVQQNIWF